MRVRILLILASTLAVMVGTMLVATQTILHEGYENLERITMAENLERVRNAMARDLRSLSQTATDWASWDETYDFVRTLSPTYVENKLSPASLRNLDVDLMAFHATGRGWVHVVATTGTPHDLATLLDRYPVLGRAPPPGEIAGGVVVLDGSLWIVVSRPILDNEETLPPRGTLVLGRLLSDERLSQLSARVLLSLRITDPAGSPPRTVHLGGREVLNVQRPAPDRVASYLPLADVSGATVAVVVVETDSGSREQALRSTLASVAAIIATGLGFGAVALVFLERRVLARLHSLSSQVLAIKTGEKTSQRLDMVGTDQIAYLAAAINGLLAEVERSTRELRQSERRTAAFLDAVPDLILFLDDEGTIRDLRTPADTPSLGGDLRGRALGSLDGEIVWLDGPTRNRLEEIIRQTREKQEPGFLEAEVPVAGKSRWYEIRVSSSPGGETVVVARDVTAQHNAEAAEQKELLLRETHHRVRNNLQVISSLLALQANAAADPDTRAMLEESQDRVRSMSLIHERLSHAQKADGLGFASYLRDLVEHLERSYGDSGRIHIDTQFEEVALPEDASLPAGLLVNELLTNALRHAYPDGRTGRVRVSLGGTTDGRIEIRVQDDGVGLPDWVDPEHPMTLGFRIVRALVDQLDATLGVDRGRGTSFSVLLSRSTR